MGIREMMARDAVVTTKPGHFGETVTYRPAAGGSNVIPAIVQRQEPDARPETNRARFQRARLLIPYSADPTKGITNPLKDRDRVDVVLRVGQAAKTCRVTAVEGGDEGWWLLEVTA